MKIKIEIERLSEDCFEVVIDDSRNGHYTELARAKAAAKRMIQGALYCRLKWSIAPREPLSEAPQRWIGNIQP